MTDRSLCLGLAAAAFVLLAGLPAPASAGPSPVLAASDAAELLQPAGYDGKRRWRYRNGTHVRAPFTSVDTRRDTYVAAPFARV